MDSLKNTSLVGTIATGTVESMIVYSGNLYVGGVFANINGVSNTKNIAKFNDAVIITAVIENETNPISVYPNPSNGQFIVDAGIATVNVYDCLGQLVYSIKMNGKETVNIEKSGMYIVQVVKGEKVYISRIINK
jgi:hypothetical protein